jgi:glycerol-3-phosphate dehydrogenase (NAD(P)+)
MILDRLSSVDLHNETGMPREIGIVGAGGWGTALAKVLADKGERVTLWCHGTECYRELSIKRENRTYLPGIQIPDAVELTQSLKNVVGDKFLVICAVPSHAVREVFAKAVGELTPETLMLCATKGLEEGTNRTMGELFADLFGPANDQRQGFLSGPTFAREVALGLPAAVTVAACSAKLPGQFRRS